MCEQTEHAKDNCGKSIDRIFCLSCGLNEYITPKESHERSVGQCDCGQDFLYGRYCLECEGTGMTEGTGLFGTDNLTCLACNGHGHTTGRAS